MKNKLATLPQLVEILGPRIAQQRQKMGWTQTKLAIRMGVNQTTIAIWETGGQVPKREHLDQLCDIFGVNRYVFEALG